MPLKKGSSQETIGKNISTMRHEGVKMRQAIAIAMSVAGKKKKNRKGDNKSK